VVRLESTFELELGAEGHFHIWLRSCGNEPPRDITIQVDVYNAEKRLWLNPSCVLASGFVSHRFVNHRSPKHDP
jgi:hypothetical protein